MLGTLAGLLVALTLHYLWPNDGEPDVGHYRAVRDFVRESFVRDVSDEELVEHALHGMLSALDPYSRYYDAREVEDLQRETSGRYVGVGIIFRRPVRQGQALFCLPGSPADRAGIEVGDQFLEIDQRGVASISESELRQILSTERDTPLQARVRNLAGVEREIELMPGSVIDPSLRHARIIDPDRGIGYISLLSFSRETPGEFLRAFDFLKRRGMQALVLDLRRNYGGVLTSAVEIAERFIANGVIVSTEGRGRPINTKAKESHATLLGFPLTVLVDEDSASASEILAGALQDHRAAVVVGAPTYGKGMVQSMHHFEDVDSIAKVTSSYYYSPSGRNFERSADRHRDYGIVPDITVEMSREERATVHAFLSGYGPPLDAIPVLERWQAELDEELIEPLPEDRQLQTALKLFAGVRPGEAIAQR